MGPLERLWLEALQVQYPTLATMHGPAAGTVSLVVPRAVALKGRHQVAVMSTTEMRP